MAIVADSVRTHALDTAPNFPLLLLVRKEEFEEVTLNSNYAVVSDEEQEIRRNCMQEVYKSHHQSWDLHDNDWSNEFLLNGVLHEIEPDWWVLLHARINPEAQQFGYSLIELLTMQPVDEGYEHPGEQLIAGSLSSKPSIAPAWIRRVYLEKESSNPVLAGEILKCISQLASLDDPEWAIMLASRGLDSPEIQLREAAVRVFESWGNKSFSHFLDDFANRETISWLADYARDVFEDLNE